MSRALPFFKSAGWHADRRLGIGGSDSNKIAAADPADLIDLWLEKRGEKEPEDLSMVLPVLIGSATEELNRYYYERLTGRTAHSDGSVFIAPDHSFMRCNLDGLTTTSAGKEAVLECKHVNAFGNIEDVVQKYMAQSHHNMHCAGLNWAVLSIIHGTQKFEVFEIEMDPLYMAELIDAERHFWNCVQDGTAPAALPVEAPITLEAMIDMDMTGSNEFAMQAGIWLETKPHVERHEASVLAIKGDKKKKVAGIVPPNCKRAWGYGVECRRSKSGAMTISAMEV